MDPSAMNNREPSKHRKPRSYLLTSAKIIVAVIPFVWVYLTIDLDQIGNSIAAVSWWTLPVFMTNILISILLQGFRWWILLRAQISGLPLSKTLKIHLISNYYSLVLPSSAAQDVVRAAILSREHDYRAAWASAWVARLLGLAVLCSFSIFGLSLVKGPTIPDWISITVYMATSAILVFSFLSFTKAVSKRVRPLMRALLAPKHLAVIEDIRESIYLYRRSKSALVLSLATTFAVQLLMMWNASLVIYGITGRYLFLECLAFMSVIEVVSITVPLTPNGIGVRETLLIGFFNMFHLSDEALAIYISIGITAIGMKLTGIVPVLFDRFGHNGREN